MYMNDARDKKITHWNLCIITYTFLISCFILKKNKKKKKNLLYDYKNDQKKLSILIINNDYNKIRSKYLNTTDTHFQSKFDYSAIRTIRALIKKKKKKKKERENLNPRSMLKKYTR